MEDKRKGYKTAQQQKEADKRWIEKNKEHKNYLSRRSNARGFIRTLAKKEDLEELKELIEKNQKGDTTMKSKKVIKKEDFIFRINNLRFDHCKADTKVLEDIKTLDSYVFTDDEKNTISLYIKDCKNEMIERVELLAKIIKKYDVNDVYENYDIDALSEKLNILNKVTFELNKLIKK